MSIEPGLEGEDIPEFKTIEEEVNFWKMKFIQKKIEYEELDQR
jgi:hypothetical protein